MPSDPKTRLTKSPAFWLLVLILAVSPFQIGLFFQREWFYTHIFSAILLVLTAILRRKHIGFFAFKQDWLSLGLVLVYLVSTLFAVKTRSAIGESLKMLNYFAVYWVVVYGGWSKKDFRTLLTVLFWSGVGVAAVGLCTVLGVYDLTGGYVEGRIYSTFQYANTLAAFLGFMIILGLYVGNETKSLVRLIYPGALYILTVCLSATGSRGGIAALIGALPILFFMLPKTLRWKYIGILILCLAMGAAGASLFLKFIAGNNTVYAWWILIGGAVCTSAIAVLPSRINGLHFKFVASVLGVIVVTIAIIYGLSAGSANPLTRIMSTSPQLHEFQERLAYYRDGAEMVAQSPVLGYGGGGWALYPLYQKFPYRVTDPHSQPIKVAVESGLVGLGIYIAWWCLTGYTAWRRARRGDVLAACLFSGLTIIGLHSLIDFDLSFGAMGLLLWAITGIIVRGDKLNHLQSSRRMRFSSITAAILLAAVLSYSGVSLLEAVEQEGWSTFYQRQELQAKALLHLESARRLDPFSSGFPAAEAQIYATAPDMLDLNKSEQSIAAALRLDGTDPNLFELAAKIYAARGEYELSAKMADKVLAFRSLEPNAYLAYAQFFDSLAEKAQKGGQDYLARNLLLQGARAAQLLNNKLNGVSERDARLWVGGKPAEFQELDMKAAEMTRKATLIP